MNENERKEKNSHDLLGAVEVTPEMVEAGFLVLVASGIADDYLGADKLLVERIYRAMVAPASPPSLQGGEE